MFFQKFTERRTARRRQTRVRPMLEVLEDRLLLSVIYDESVSGDLSNNQAAPKALTLALGTNSIKGTVGGSDTQDWITLHVPAGMSLGSLVLATYQSSDSQGFMGVQKGTSFVGDSQSASPYLGYAHFGTSATNGSLPATNLVGTNLLPIMGNTSLAFGSQGFAPPLASGDYTFLIQQLGASTIYQFDFDTVAPTLKSIAVTPANPSIAKGRTQQFTATGTFSDNSTQNLTSQATWVSATPTVATITAAGLASGAGTGTSTISAAMSGITGTTVLTVTAAVLQSIAVTPANPIVAKGLTKQFTATGTFSDNSTQDLTSQVAWGSANSTAATITATGLASGMGIGASTISASKSGVTGSTVLSVTAAALQSIAVTPANPSVAKGLTDQFTATGTFSDNSTQNLTSQVTWASATPAVATITAAGLATAVGSGTSTIPAALSGHCNIPFSRCHAPVRRAGPGRHPGDRSQQRS
jgi:hypothetical protein